MLVNQWELGCKSFNWHLLHGKPCFHDTAGSSTPRHQARENAYAYTLPATDLMQQMHLKMLHSVSVNLHKNRWNVPKNRCSIGQRASPCVSSYIYFHFLSFPREIKLDQLGRSANVSICTTYLPTKTGWEIHRGDDVNVAERTK